MCGSFEGSHRVSLCWQWATSPFWVASHWEVCSCWVGMNGFVWVYLRWPCWGMQRELQEKWRRRCCKSEQRNGRKITAVFSEHNAASRMSLFVKFVLVHPLRRHYAGLKRQESWLVGVQRVVCHDSRQSHDKNDSTAAYLMTILKN